MGQRVVVAVVGCGVVWGAVGCCGVEEREGACVMLASLCVVRCRIVWRGVAWRGVMWRGAVHVLGGADPSVGLSVGEATPPSPSSTLASPGGVGVPAPSDAMALR